VEVEVCVGHRDSFMQYVLCARVRAHDFKLLKRRERKKFETYLTIKESWLGAQKLLLGKKVYF